MSLDEGGAANALGASARLAEAARTARARVPWLVALAVALWGAGGFLVVGGSVATVNPWRLLVLDRNLTGLVTGVCVGFILVGLGGFAARRRWRWLRWPARAMLLLAGLAFFAACITAMESLPRELSMQTSSGFRVALQDGPSWDFDIDNHEGCSRFDLRVGQGFLTRHRQSPCVDWRVASNPRMSLRGDELILQFAEVTCEYSIEAGSLSWSSSTTADERCLLFDAAEGS